MYCIFCVVNINFVYMFALIDAYPYFQRSILQNKKPMNLSFKRQYYIVENACSIFTKTWI